jgi:hypothetical protein
MEELQAASGARIVLHRKNLPHCLYCEATPNTEEHVVPEAIGGRLWARILCGQHNSAIAAGADEPLSKAFAPYVTMLQVSRQRGGAGAEFTATGRDGKPIVILAEGFAKELPLDVKRRDERGRIAHAEGDLAVLDGLPAEAFAEGVPRNIIAKITVPEARFTVASDDRIRPGVLKIALHFVAGFVTDVDLASAQGLLPFVLGEKNPTGDMVRTPFLDEDVFADESTPRHEITCYNDGDGVLVTIMLFGAMAYACRFPFGGDAVAGIRYTQRLDKNYPEFYDQVERPAVLDWNRRPSESAADGKLWMESVETRMRRVNQRGVEQSIQARSRRAFDCARGLSSNYGNLWERYAAALQLEVFSAEEVGTIVAIGRRLHANGENAWEVPVTLDDPSAQG